MELVDTMIAAVSFGGILLWKLAQEPIVWGIIVAVILLGTGARVTVGKCPKCHSTDTRPHRMILGGHVQADWYLDVDSTTGDFYAVRYDRVCRKCRHRWISGLEDVLGEDSRPVRKKIYNARAWRRIMEHSQRRKGS